MRVGDSLIPLLLTDSVRNYACLGFSYLLPSSDEIHNQIDMHLMADGCGEGLISYLLLMYLFPKTDWINHAFHLSKLCLCDILALSSHSLIISKFFLARISISWPNTISIFLYIILTKGENHVLLKVIIQHLTLVVLWASSRILKLVRWLICLIFLCRLCTWIHLLGLTPFRWWIWSAMIRFSHY